MVVPVVSQSSKSAAAQGRRSFTALTHGAGFSGPLPVGDRSSDGVQAESGFEKGQNATAWARKVVRTGMPSDFTRVPSRFAALRAPPGDPFPVLAQAGCPLKGERARFRRVIRTSMSPITSSRTGMHTHWSHPLPCPNTRCRLLTDWQSGGASRIAASLLENMYGSCTAPAPWMTGLMNPPSRMSQLSGTS